LGEHIRQFAHAHGLNPRTLAWWKWRLKQRPATEPARFVPVVLDQHAELELHIGGAVVVVDEQTDLSLVKRLVQALT